MRAMRITVNGRAYLIRGNYTPAQLREHYAAFCAKYGVRLTFERWLAERGKVYGRIRP